MPHIPKTPRYTLGQKIDSLLLETIELVFTASYLSKHQKQPFVQKAVGKFDLLKLFLQIAWENKILDNEKYAALGHKLYEIGKHIGGWNKSLAE